MPNGQGYNYLNKQEGRCTMQLLLACLFRRKNYQQFNFSANSQSICMLEEAFSETIMHVWLLMQDVLGL